MMPTTENKVSTENKNNDSLHVNWYGVQVNSDIVCTVGSFLGEMKDIQSYELTCTAHRFSLYPTWKELTKREKYTYQCFDFKTFDKLEQAKWNYIFSKFVINFIENNRNENATLDFSNKKVIEILRGEGLGKKCPSLTAYFTLLLETKTVSERYHRTADKFTLFSTERLTYSGDTLVKLFVKTLFESRAVNEWHEEYIKYDEVNSHNTAPYYKLCEEIIDKDIPFPPSLFDYFNFDLEKTSILKLALKAAEKKDYDLLKYFLTKDKVKIGVLDLILGPKYIGKSILSENYRLIPFNYRLTTVMSNEKDYVAVMISVLEKAVAFTKDSFFSDHLKKWQECQSEMIKIESEKK